MLFLTKYESNFIKHGFFSPSHYNGVEGCGRGGGGGGGGGGGDVIRKFAKILWWQNFVLHLWHGKPLRVIQKVSPLRRGGGSLEREQKRTEGEEGEVLAYV